MGPICRNMVESGHIAYPCTLAFGHIGEPTDDPQPCYAMEAASSVRRWQAWRLRQDEKAKNAAAEPPTEVSVTTGEITATIRTRHCQDTVAHEIHLWEPEGEEEETFYCNGFGSPGEASVVEPSAEEQTVFEALAAATPQGAGGSDHQFADCGPACRASGEHTPADPRCVMSPALTEAEQKTVAKKATTRKRATKKAAPTKQREGDQPLPKPGQQCVQDLIIEEMQESKRVGMERYGSTLQTFNGRRTIQDVAEEVRDLHVYLKQVEAEGQANRETLIGVVTKALTSYPGQSQLEGAPENAAETAVDAIMGWVTAQLAGGSGAGA
jgi:hypothetical protein